MKKKKVLTVDDDPNIIELLNVNLENAGYSVVSANDGEEALEKAEKEKPDLIILDIVMPKLDGFGVCQKLRERRTTTLTPIIVLSADDKPVDKITGLRLGADDYVTKPFNIGEFLARVDMIMRRTSRALSANPLTNLPGNESIMIEAFRRMREKQKFAFVYLDIDNFKAYNDRYGFRKGDEAIRVVADILKKCSDENDFIGHIGGDDFILLCGIEKAEEKCRCIMELFDNSVDGCYNDEDRNRGYITAKDRKGQEQRFPLMTLSMGIVTNEKKELNHYGRIVEIATEMKRLAKTNKQENRSSFAVDKRYLSGGAGRTDSSASSL